MYGNFPKTDNGLSPRSKMISMGLNNIQPVPLRFRPSGTTTDYIDSGAPTMSDRGDNYVGSNNNNNNDDCKFVNHMNQQDSRPSPDELRGQYTEFQRKLINEQMSGNYNHDTVSPERAKILRDGMDYQGSLSPKSDKPKFSGYGSLGGNFQADQGVPIEQSRKKFVRKVDEDYIEGKMDGLAIGKQTDKETMMRTKRAQQAAYQQQLANDRLTKPVARDRKIVERREISPQDHRVSLMDRIGDRTDGSSGAAEAAAAEQRRRDAQRVLATNRDDVLARLNEGTSPDNRKMRQESMHNRGDEAAKFEEAPYRFIGGSLETNRDRKKAMQEQYLAQLLADNGPPAQGRAPMRDAPEYTNRSGWTGLIIGGHSSDEANKRDAAEEKHLKQATYKHLLDQQKLQADDLARYNQMKYGKY